LLPGRLDTARRPVQAESKSVANNGVSGFIMVGAVG
jgi:preprotein translocase subunit Sss1